MTEELHQIAVGQIYFNDIAVKFIGDQRIIRQTKYGVFCSKKCPGDLILKAFDATKKLREQGRVVISSFHSPVEKDLLPILLRGNQPVVIAMGRDLEGCRIPKRLWSKIENNQLAFISPVYQTKQPRITRYSADIRNSLLAKICSQVLVIYAEFGGAVDRIVDECLLSGRDIFALKGEKNQYLFDKGVKPWGQ
jgi:predicted Rossmann fold nucleotide-binding protein DprA/Smf involved in DNA uptake